MKVRWTLDRFSRPTGRAALAGQLSEPLGERTERLAQLGIVWRRIGERLPRAGDAGEIRTDVDTEALISVTGGAGVMVALLDGESAIDEARMNSLVSMVADGVRPGGRAEGLPVNPPPR